MTGHGNIAARVPRSGGFTLVRPPLRTTSSRAAAQCSQPLMVEMVDTVAAIRKSPRSWFVCATYVRIVPE